MALYKYINNKLGQPYNIKKQDPEKPLWIPINEENADYQEYLKWVAEGNTIEPADEE